MKKEITSTRKKYFFFLKKKEKLPLIVVEYNERPMFENAEKAN